MRAAMLACSVAITLTSRISAVDMYAPGSPRSTPRPASSRNNLLGEKRITGGPRDDRLAQLADPCVTSEQLGNQCRRLRIAQWRKGYRLRTRQLGQQTAIFRSICDQHQRARLRYHGEEVAQHRLAGLIDPVCVLNDIDRRGLSGQRRDFTRAVSRRQRASGSILGRAVSGSAMASRSSRSTKSSGSASVTWARTRSRWSPRSDLAHRWPRATAVRPRGRGPGWCATRRTR